MSRTQNDLKCLTDWIKVLLLVVLRETASLSKTSELTEQAGLLANEIAEKFRRRSSKPADFLSLDIDGDDVPVPTVLWLSMEKNVKGWWILRVDVDLRDGSNATVEILARWLPPSINISGKASQWSGRSGSVAGHAYNPDRSTWLHRVDGSSGSRNSLPVHGR